MSDTWSMEQHLCSAPNLRSTHTTRHHANGEQQSSRQSMEDIVLETYHSERELELAAVAMLLRGFAKDGASLLMLAEGDLGDLLDTSDFLSLCEEDDCASCTSSDNSKLGHDLYDPLLLRKERSSGSLRKFYTASFPGVSSSLEKPRM